MRRGFHPLGKGFGLRVTIRRAEEFRVDDDKPILLPGEWEVNTRRERQKQGIPLDAGSWQAICDAARQIGMPEETLQAFCQQLAS